MSEACKYTVFIAQKEVVCPICQKPVRFLHDSRGFIFYDSFQIRCDCTCSRVFGDKVSAINDWLIRLSLKIKETGSNENMNVHDATEQAYKNGFEAGYRKARVAIVESKGRWEIVTYDPAVTLCVCSICHGAVYSDSFEILPHNYCPKCGTKMENTWDVIKELKAINKAKRLIANQRGVKRWISKLPWKRK